MIFKKFSFVVTAALILAALTAVNAKEKSSDVKIKGKIFMQYEQELNDAKDKDETKTGTFEVTRAYIQILKNIGGPFSIKITGDAIKGIKDSNGDTGKHYDFYLKNAYLQGKGNVGMFALKAQLGLIGTPLIGITDKMSDYRWIYNNFFDKAKNLNVQNGESSADLGFSLNAKIMDKVSVTGAVVNGEGYKSVDENEKNSGKAYYGLLSVTPLKGLYINGYLRLENEEVDNSKKSYYAKDSIYYGGGIGWKNKLIKIGFNYIIGKRTDDDPALTDSTVNEFKLFDSWLNINLETFTGMPILILGRFAFGEDDKVTDSMVTYWGAGLGYRFNKNFRLAAYLDNYKYDDSATYTETNQQSFYIKAEAKY